MSDQHKQMITRTFGPDARLGGDWGGELRIIVGGVVVGRGLNLQAAIRSAQRVLSVVAAWQG